MHAGEAMGRHHMRSRRHKRQFVADANALQRALVGVSKISAEDVARQVAAMRIAIDGLLAGHNGSDCWRSMADAANVAESLAELGIGGGEEARQVIAEAQEALAWIVQERRERGTWALRADERDEIRRRLTWLASVHATQLSHASYSEFERAYQATARRVQQARAGNAAKGSIVIEGVIA